MPIGRSRLLTNACTSSSGIDQSNLPSIRSQIIDHGIAGARVQPDSHPAPSMPRDGGTAPITATMPSPKGSENVLDAIGAPAAG